MEKKLDTPVVKIGEVLMGGDYPVVIQAMTNTDTADAGATARQCIELAEAGAEMVRVTVNSNFAAPAVPSIRRIMDREGYEHVPLIGDFHYNGHILLEEFPKMAKALDKYRINPGNVGFGDKHEYNFCSIVEKAVKYDKPVRIGVNWGSLDQDLLTELMDENSANGSPLSDHQVLIEAMVKSAMRSAALAEKCGLRRDQIVLSVKMSVVQDVIAAYQLLAERMKQSGQVYALHLGLTEAGSDDQGTISSAAALAILLQQGIGDTIRISLTPQPGQPRSREVESCKILLQSMGYRYFSPQITSCPGCGRTDSTLFQETANDINAHIKKNLKQWKKDYPGIENLKIAVMGCIVNGPGESKHADIAISFPGKLEKPVAPVYISGQYTKSLSGDNISAQFIEILEDFVRSRNS